MIIINLIFFVILSISKFCIFVCKYIVDYKSKSNRSQRPSELLSAKLYSVSKGGSIGTNRVKASKSVRKLNEKKKRKYRNAFAIFTRN